MKKFFNKLAKNTIEFSQDPWFVVACAGIALITLPFNAGLSVIALSVPTVYQTLGHMSKVVARGLKA